MNAAVLLIILFFIILLIVSGSCFLIGRKTAKNPVSYLRRHPAFARFFLLAYTAFAGCFEFPVRSDPFPLDFMKLYLLAASYGIIGLGFAGLYGKGKERTVYPATLVLTAAGMLCRYLLEFGEISNTYNFTLWNIISYLALIPVFTVIAYHYIVKHVLLKK